MRSGMLNDIPWLRKTARSLPGDYYSSNIRYERPKSTPLC
jgi:hypothetical protein